MKTQMPKATVLMSLAAAAFLSGGSPTSAQSVEQFYRGKTITLQIGYGPGGGYDTYARHVARHFGKHVPGRPTVVPQNVPGAGSLKLTNALFNSAPRDGTVIGAIGREQVTAPLFGVKGAQFDATKFGWLGNLDSAASLCVAWHASPFKSMEDVRKKEMVVGGTGPASITVVLPTVLNQILGYNFKVVAGYPGGNDITLALERGEVQGRCGWSYASLKGTQAQWLAEKKLRFLAVSSFKRLKELPDVPSVIEFAKSARDKQVLELVLAGQAMARPYVTPPGIPEDRLKVLREAFSAMMRDPEFLRGAQKQNLELDPMEWTEMTEVIARIYSTPKPVIEATIKAMKRTESK
jgi:tripartite-type tricarboxylate transporter receptor subunit TctC